MPASEYDIHILYSGGICLSEIQVQGLKRLNGEIRVQGSKNAVLPMMAGALLASGTTVIHHVPAIDDVFTMMEILEDLGCIVRYSSGDPAAAYQKSVWEECGLPASF